MPQREREKAREAVVRRLEEEYGGYHYTQRHCRRHAEKFGNSTISVTGTKSIAARTCVCVAERPERETETDIQTERDRGTEKKNMHCVSSEGETEKQRDVVELRRSERQRNTEKHVAALHKIGVSQMETRL